MRANRLESPNPVTTLNEIEAKATILVSLSLFAHPHLLCRPALFLSMPCLRYLRQRRQLISLPL